MSLDCKKKVFEFNILQCTLCPQMFAHEPPPGRVHICFHVQHNLKWFTNCPVNCRLLNLTLLTVYPWHFCLLWVSNRNLLFLRTSHYKYSGWHRGKGTTVKVSMLHKAHSNPQVHTFSFDFQNMTMWCRVSLCVPCRCEAATGHGDLCVWPSKV